MNNPIIHKNYQRLSFLNCSLEDLEKHPCGIPSECETIYGKNKWGQKDINQMHFVYGSLKGETIEITESAFWNTFIQYNPIAIIYNATITTHNQFCNILPHSQNL